MRNSLRQGRIGLGWWVIAAAVVAGCEKRDAEPVAYVGPTLTNPDLGMTGTATSGTGYEIVETTGSVGRFPGTLSVARLKPPGLFTFKDEGTTRTWRIGTMAFEDVVGWNGLFDRLPYVQGVRVLDELVVMWPEADLAAINTSAKRLESALCLIYGPTSAPPEHASLAGVVLDTQRAQAVAFIRAQAGPEDFLPPPADTLKNDLRYRDPNYLAARKFEWQFRRCVADLESRDQPVSATQPSDWRDRALDRRERSIYIVPNKDIRW